MEYDKKYILKCDHAINEKIKQILSDCNVKGKEIIVDQAKNLNLVFTTLNEVGITVIDLEIKQKSLYDFFY